MKVLVSVGSSSFDSLVCAVDSIANLFPNYEFTFQISNGKYTPTIGDFFSFSNSFSQYIDNADIIITHAGAGTVFELLEKHKKCIVIPNYERIDQHQSDLASFIEKNSLAIVCHDLKNINQCLQEVEAFNPTLYVKTAFFRTNELVELFS
tara:strand:+ start:1261 stop:1710 length:450 start_codon:yes stop_codon:yes gene_type:complete